MATIVAAQIDPLLYAKKISRAHFGKCNLALHHSKVCGNTLSCLKF
jgi:hypothetical protein